MGGIAGVSGRPLEKKTRQSAPFPECCLASSPTTLHLRRTSASPTAPFPQSFQPFMRCCDRLAPVPHMSRPLAEQSSTHAVFTQYTLYTPSQSRPPSPFLPPPSSLPVPSPCSRSFLVLPSQSFFSQSYLVPRSLNLPSLPAPFRTCDSAYPQ